MHYHRIHSGKIRARGQRRFKTRPAGGKNDRPPAAINLGSDRLAQPPVKKVDRRTKAWRAANPKLAKPMGRFTNGKRNGKGRRNLHPANPAAVNTATEVKINFCNNCGASIAGQAQGVVLAQLMNNNPRFRAMVEKLLEKHT